MLVITATAVIKLCSFTTASFSFITDKILTFNKDLYKKQQKGYHSSGRTRCNITMYMGGLAWQQKTTNMKHLYKNLYSGRKLVNTTTGATLISPNLHHKKSLQSVDIVKDKRPWYTLGIFGPRDKDTIAPKNDSAQMTFTVDYIDTNHHWQSFPSPTQG